MIGFTGTDTNYAEFLLSLSRANMGRYPVCSGMSGSSLKERVRAILEKKEAFKKMSKKGMVSLLVAILSVVFMASMVRLADTAPAESGKLAFSKVLDGNWQIVVTDKNGQNLINLSDQRGKLGFTNIYKMDSDGENVVRLT